MGASYSNVEFIIYTCLGRSQLILYISYIFTHIAGYFRLKILEFKFGKENYLRDVQGFDF